MTAHLNFKRISLHALQCSRSLVPTLLPGGVQKGREWIALNPRRPDQSLGSFKINLETGKWADFSTGDAGGDLISLVAFLDGCSQVAAAKKIILMIGKNK